VIHASPAMPTDDVNPMTRVVLRPLASPLPVGFLALAIGSLVLAGLQLKWIPASQGHTAGLCLIGVVVPLQAVSFVFGLLARDQSAGTAMGLLTGSWLAIGLVTVTAKPRGGQRRAGTAAARICGRLARSSDIGRREQAACRRGHQHDRAPVRLRCGI
jgi:hypothetical protein